MKQTIRLTESQFKKVITETVKKVLREENEEYGIKSKFNFGELVLDKHLNDNVVYTIKGLHDSFKNQGNDRIINVYNIANDDATTEKEYNYHRASEDDLVRI